MATLKRIRFLAVVNEPADDGTDVEFTHVVTVRPVDQLRAELEGHRRGVDHKFAVHMTHMWVWSALLRDGVLEPGTTFDAFLDRLVALDDGPDADDSDPEGGGDVEDVRPTVPGSSG